MGFLLPRIDGDGINFCCCAHSKNSAIDTRMLAWWWSCVFVPQKDPRHRRHMRLRHLCTLECYLQETGISTVLQQLLHSENKSPNLCKKVPLFFTPFLSWAVHFVIWWCGLHLFRAAEVFSEKLWLRSVVKSLLFSSLQFSEFGECRIFQILPLLRRRKATHYKSVEKTAEERGHSCPAWITPWAGRNLPPKAPPALRWWLHSIDKSLLPSSLEFFRICSDAKSAWGGKQTAEHRGHSS